MSRAYVMATEAWLKSKLGKDRFKYLKRNPRTVVFDGVVADFTIIGAKPGTVNFYIRRARWHDYHRPVSLKELEEDLQRYP